MREKLPILKYDETRALIRRGRKIIRRKYGKKRAMTFANRAHAAAEILARFGGLTIEQTYLFVPFISDLAAGCKD